VVQRNFYEVHGSQMPDKKNFKAGFDKLLVAGNICKQYESVHDGVSDKRVKQLHHAFQRNLTKTSNQASSM
jgi:hypothetical protein